MSAAEKKPAKNTRKATKPDVDRPGKSAPPTTSKPVIVSNRPLLKDPMVVDEEAASQEGASEKQELAHSAGPKLKPLEEPPKPEPEPEPKPEPEAADETPAAETEATAEDDAPPAKSAPKSEAKPKQKDEAAAAEQAKHDAAIQELIISQKYELPINSVEKRKAKHFVVLGIFLAILLALAWGDIAADAGIIHINGVKPVTHFFSN